MKSPPLSTYSARESGLQASLDDSEDDLAAKGLVVYCRRMKNYARKTNRAVTRFRTPSMFRIRKHIEVTKLRTRYDDTVHYRNS